MTFFTSCELSLPDWVEPFLAESPGNFPDDVSAMNFALALARENIQQATGGPFAAVVLNPVDGAVVSVGVNTVTTNGLSVAHAEILALSLAQRRVNDWNLARFRPYTLYSTCEPCAMCFGALPWSGIRRLVCGARREDAENAGFDEGDKPADWVASLQRRGIDVLRDMRREPAKELFDMYRASGGELYTVTGEYDHE